MGDPIFEFLCYWRPINRSDCQTVHFLLFFFFFFFINCPHLNPDYSMNQEEEENISPYVYSLVVYISTQTTPLVRNRKEILPHHIQESVSIYLRGDNCWHLTWQKKK